MRRVKSLPVRGRQTAQNRPWEGQPKADGGRPPVSVKKLGVATGAGADRNRALSTSQRRPAKLRSSEAFGLFTIFVQRNIMYETAFGWFAGSGDSGTSWCEQILAA